MAVSRVKAHKYLGTTLDYTVHGQVQITMIDFLDEFLTDFDKAEPKGGQHKDKCSTRESIQGGKKLREASTE